MKNELLEILNSMYDDAMTAIEILADKNKCQDLLDLLTYMSDMDDNSEYYTDLLREIQELKKYGSWGAMERINKYLYHIMYVNK